MLEMLNEAVMWNGSQVQQHDRSPVVVQLGTAEERRASLITALSKPLQRMRSSTGNEGLVKHLYVQQDISS